MATNRPTGAGEAPRKRPKTQAAASSAAGDEEIRVLAYQLYVRRCADGIDGDALTDWAEAERQLRRP